MLFCNVYVNSMELIKFSPCFPCKNGISLVREMPFSNIYKKKFLLLFLTVPGHQFSFQELKEQVEDEAQYGEDDDSCHEAFGNHEVAVVEDQGADALFGGNHFGRHQKEEGGAGGYAETGEDHGEGVGKHHVSHGVARPAWKLTATLISRVSTFFTPE